MQGKNYRSITLNAKRVTSPCEFCHCYACDLLRDIGRIFIFLRNVSWNTTCVSCVWPYFYPYNLKTPPFIPNGCDIWKYEEVLNYTVQKPDNCCLNEFNSSGLLLDIWKSHKMDCYSLTLFLRIRWKSSDKPLQFVYVSHHKVTSLF